MMSWYSDLARHHGLHQEADDAQIEPVPHHPSDELVAR